MPKEYSTKGGRVSASALPSFHFLAFITAWVRLYLHPGHKNGGDIENVQKHNNCMYQSVYQ